MPTFVVINMDFVYFIGTAGSGKSTLTAAFSNWMKDLDRYAITVNLDPGVKRLPYRPEVDVREFIDFDTVVDKYNLGPNGALIATMDLLASNLSDIIHEINDFNADYVLIDTPGQLELFVFRSVGPYMVGVLSSGKRNNTTLAYLLDANICRKPENLISLQLLGMSMQFRFIKPQLNVLTKVDLLSKVELSQILDWMKEETQLMDSINKHLKGPIRELALKVNSTLHEFEVFTEAIPVSTKTEDGLDVLYGILQRIFAGGEDLIFFK